MITHVDEQKWVLVHDFILNLGLGTLKLVDGMSCLTQIHETLSIACLRSNILIHAKLLRRLKQFFPQSLFLDFPFIIFLAQHIKYFRCLFQLLVHYQSIGIHAPYEKYVILNLWKLLRSQSIQNFLKSMGIDEAKYTLNLIQSKVDVD